MLQLRIGEPLLVRTHRRVSAGSFCDMKSTTKLPHASAIRSCCARGSAKPVALRSNASPKSGETATACFCQKLVPCGARSMRKPTGPPASQRKCAHSFLSERGWRGCGIRYGVVVKVLSLPYLVPALFVALIRKWYVVLAVNPEMFALTF
jgi:hypothetical protein